jgi:hypothetical protein
LDATDSVVNEKFVEEEVVEEEVYEEEVYEDEVVVEEELCEEEVFEEELVEEEAFEEEIVEEGLVEVVPSVVSTGVTASNNDTVADSAVGEPAVEIQPCVEQSYQHEDLPFAQVSTELDDMETETNTEMPATSNEAIEVSAVDKRTRSSGATLTYECIDAGNTIEPELDVLESAYAKEESLLEEVPTDNAQAVSTPTADTVQNPGETEPIYVLASSHDNEAGTIVKANADEIKVTNAQNIESIIDKVAEEACQVSNKNTTLSDEVTSTEDSNLEIAEQVMSPYSEKYIKEKTDGSDIMVYHVMKDVEKDSAELSTKGTDVADAATGIEGSNDDSLDQNRDNTATATDNVILEETPIETAAASKKKKKKKNRKKHNKKKKAATPAAARAEDAVDDENENTGFVDTAAGTDDDKMDEVEICEDEKLRFTNLLNIDPWSSDDDNVDFSELERLVETYPQFCAETHKLDAFNESVYPLSALCSIGAPVELVMKCIAAYNGALSEKDPWIGNPLHYACAYKATLPVAEALVQKRPDCLKETNQFRRLPLHM